MQKIISNVVDIRIWKMNKSRHWIDQLDLQRKKLKHLTLIK